MFSLIITLVAIALTISLAAAALYYGGVNATRTKNEAEAARLLNESAQIKAGLILEKTATGNVTSDQSVLVSRGYLAKELSGWVLGDGFIYYPGVNLDVCEAANRKVGVASTPSCDSPDTTAVCCKAE